jgi:hypothetical protein
MTKARTLANFISDGSTLADGAISVSEVSGAAPLASPTFTGTTTQSGVLNMNTNYIQFQGNLSKPNVGAAIYRPAADSVAVVTNNQDRMVISNTEVNFNEDSNNTDFRVESDNNANMLFVDAGNDKVLIGSGTSGDGAGTSAAVVYSAADSYSTTSVTNAGLSIDKINSSGNGQISALGFRATGNGTSNNAHGRIVLGQPVASSHAARFHFQLRKSNGNTAETLRMDPDYNVFNDDGNDMDFRVESDSNANMLHVDAGANIVNVGTNNSGYNGTFNVASGTNTQVAAFESALGGAGAAATIRLGVSTRSSQGLIIGSNGNGASVNGGSLAAYVLNSENAALSFGTNNSLNAQLTTNGHFNAQGIGFGRNSVTESTSMLAGKITSGSPMTFDCVLDSSTGDWSPAYMLILANTTNSNQANILAAWWLYNMTHYNGSLAGVSLRDSGGNTGSFTVTISDQGGTDPITVRASITNPTNRMNARIEVGNYYGVASIT